MSASPPPPQRSELEEAVRVAISDKLRVTQWPDSLRYAYLAHRDNAAREDLRLLGQVGLAVIILSNLLDWLAVPEAALLGLQLRLGLLVPLTLATMAVGNRLKTWQIKLITAGNTMLFTGIIFHMGSFADPATATRYTMAAICLMGLGLLLLPFRLAELVLFSLAMVATAAVASVWPQPVPGFDLAQHLVLAALVIGGTLTISYRHDDTRARAFLYDLRDSYMRAELEQNVRILRELSELDPLTGLANRRSFRSSFDSRFAGSTRAPGLSVTVMMIDLDHFKRFNDEFGHQAGDRALRHVGRCLEAGFSGVDGIVARFGGEEFIAAFHSASVAEAERLAEDVRSAICALDIPVRDNRSQRITTSIGLASAGPEAMVDLGELTARADRALYRAKSDGRNRVVSSEKIELRIDRLAG